MNKALIIRGLTNMSKEEYAQLEYKVGLAFLQLMENDTPQLMNYLERSNKYWSWWKIQFANLGMEYINKVGIEDLTKIKKDIVRQKFIDYCTIVKVSTYGMRSYTRVATKLQLQMGKQQKNNQKNLLNEKSTNS